MRKFINLWIAIVLAIPNLTSAEEGFLSPQIISSLITDGEPWISESPNGRKFNLFLNKDGTGKIEGPLFFNLSAMWKIKGEEICLSTAMMDKCLRFKEVSEGFQGWVGEKPDMKLSRLKTK